MRHGQSRRWCLTQVVASSNTASGWRSRHLKQLHVGGGGGFLAGVCVCARCWHDRRPSPSCHALQNSSNSARVVALDFGLARPSRDVGKQKKEEQRLPDALWALLEEEAVGEIAAPAGLQGPHHRAGKAWPIWAPITSANTFLPLRQSFLLVLCAGADAAGDSGVEPLGRAEEDGQVEDGHAAR